MTESATDISELLIDYSEGNQGALDKLIPLVYDELHRLASRYLRRERPNHTLQTTALVHEAYLRLVRDENGTSKNRVQFFAVASQLMRHILVDYARSHNAAKRGGDHTKVSFDEAMILSEGKSESFIALDDALNSLAAIDPLQTRVIELRVFGGLTVEETAEVLRISPRTVKREWSMAKAWLHRQLTKDQFL